MYHLASKKQNVPRILSINKIKASIVTTLSWLNILYDLIEIWLNLCKIHFFVFPGTGWMKDETHEFLIYQKNYLEITPPKFNIAPENGPSQKESSLPTIIFQGLC